MNIRRSHLIILVCLIALTGCFESKKSLITEAQSSIPFSAGNYCAYFQDEEKLQWEDKCRQTYVKISGNTAYVNENGTETQIRIYAGAIVEGTFKDYYVTQICDLEVETKKVTACYFGALKTYDDSIHLRHPVCEGDHCNDHTALSQIIKGIEKAEYQHRSTARKFVKL